MKRNYKKGGLTTILLIFGLSSGPSFADDYPYNAAITGDFVRLRAEPSTEGNQKSFLYKYETVEVLDRKETTIPWLKVKYGNTEGWVAERFVDRDLYNPDADLFAAPGDMQWFFSRYGNSTDYMSANITAQSFTLDQYRELIAAAEKKNEIAWGALKQTIFPYLESNPDDPAFQHVKKKLYSREFLFRVASNFIAVDPTLFRYMPSEVLGDRKFVTDLVQENPYSFYQLPKKWRGDRELFRIALKKIPRLVFSIPLELREDKDILLEGLGGIKSCNPQNINARLPDSFKQDPDIQAAINKCSAKI